MAKKRDLRVVKPTRAEQKIIDRRLAARRRQRAIARVKARSKTPPRITTTRTRFVTKGLKAAGLSPAEIKKLRDK